MEIRGTWEFTWNGGQISNIKKSVTNNMGSVNPETGKYQVTPGTVANIMGDGTLMSELATAMNFPKVQTDGKFSPYSPDGEINSFTNYVQPYLTPSPVSNETVTVLDQPIVSQQKKTK